MTSTTDSPFDRPTPSVAPSKWDGTGWVADGDDWVWKQGDGRYFSNARQVWATRPDLLSGLPASPGPVPLAVKAQAEVARLRTPWPTYGEAWREAKARKSWVRRWAAFGQIPAFALICLISYTIPEEQVIGDQATFPMFIPQNWLILAVFLSGPFCFWLVYHQALKRRDSHKAAAFAIGSYVAVAAGTHAARRAGEGHPSAPIGFDQDPYSLNRGMRPPS